MSFTLELLYLVLKCIGVGLHLRDARSFGGLGGIVGSVLALDLVGARRGSVSLHLRDLGRIRRSGPLISAVVGDDIDPYERQNGHQSAS
ncbi:hypothetical protein [Rhizobium miluonense]|uniref:hypothetical protein n=1 Tax=Rhizobium miluonense TaxID=411945 RepID=UPI0013563AE2|nr:hypothetical protein [Rhizobium miluonense]